MFWFCLIDQFVDLQTQMVAVERINEVCNLDAEANNNCLDAYVKQSKAHADREFSLNIFVFL